MRGTRQKRYVVRCKCKYSDPRPITSYSLVDNFILYIIMTIYIFLMRSELTSRTDDLTCTINCTIKTMRSGLFDLKARRNGKNYTNKVFD